MSKKRFSQQHSSLTTQEAEAGELIEPRRQRLQSAKIMSLHCSLGNTARPCLKKKKSRGKGGWDPSAEDCLFFSELAPSSIKEVWTASEMAFHYLGQAGLELLNS
ncbi:hypothetical protein AAY473_021251 [Plecturocebus cupreus]